MSLDPHHIARLVTALIRAEQDRLVRKKQLPARAHIDTQTSPLGGLKFEDLSVDEEHLGFDSLARLALVERFNQFFSLSATGIEDYLLVHRTLPEWVTLLERHFEMVGDRAQIGFSTSGSTGVPVQHKHTLTALISEAMAHIASGPLRDIAPLKRALISVPVHHIYGFIWGILVPQFSGMRCLDLPPGSPGAILREAETADLIVSTPFGWELLEDAARKFPSGVWGISSGGPTTRKTWDIAQSTGVSLIEIYGASETAGVGWRRDGNADFTLCSDISTELVTGRPPRLRRITSEHCLDIQDHLSWTDAHSFQVIGRIDKQVQVGGVNVSLGHVTNVLQSLPCVKEAAVRLDEGRLKAFVVPNTKNWDVATLEDKLVSDLQELPAPARPVSFTFGAGLPRTETGKLTDWDTV